MGMNNADLIRELTQFSGSAKVEVAVGNFDRERVISDVSYEDGVVLIETEEAED